MISRDALLPEVLGSAAPLGPVGEGLPGSVTVLWLMVEVTVPPGTVPATGGIVAWETPPETVVVGRITPALAHLTTYSICDGNFFSTGLKEERNL